MAFTNLSAPVEPAGRAARRALWILAALPLAACQSIATGAFGGLNVEELADRLAGHDVVFLGEIHDNDVGHQVQLQILVELHRRRGDVVLAMEMFERDVQPWIDAWLAGSVDDEEFLAKTRPWGNYGRHYAPMVDYARLHKLPVVASNVPTEIARRVANGAEVDEVLGKHTASYSRAPKDKYWRDFKRALTSEDDTGSHAVDNKTLEAYYRAQCLKDDTMAESILAALDTEPRPLVVHLNGKFHTHDRLGIVTRLRERDKKLDVAVVTMEDIPSVRPVNRDTFEMIVSEQPQAPSKPHPPSAGDDQAEPGSAADNETHGENKIEQTPATSRETEPKSTDSSDSVSRPVVPGSRR